jgi:hypothetical protein
MAANHEAPTRRSALGRLAAAVLGSLGLAAPAAAGGGLLRRTTPAQTAPDSLDLTPRQMEEAWANLASLEGETAKQKAWLLLQGRQTLPFVQERLKPLLAPADQEKIAGHVKELDSPHFARRREATEALESAGLTAEPYLRKVLGNKPSLEVVRRVEGLLDKLAAEKRRFEWALEILALRGSPAELVTLAALANGPESWLRDQSQKRFECMQLLCWKHCHEGGRVTPESVREQALKEERERLAEIMRKHVDDLERRRFKIQREMEALRPGIGINSATPQPQPSPYRLPR